MEGIVAAGVRDGASLQIGERDDGAGERLAALSIGHHARDGRKDSLRREQDLDHTR